VKYIRAIRHYPMRAGITIEDEALTSVNLTGLSSATTSNGRVNVVKSIDKADFCASVTP